MKETTRLRQDLASLVGQTPPRKALGARDAATPLPAAAGAAKPKQPPGAQQQGGGGLISPIDETGRTYHAGKSIVSPNGLITLYYSNVASITAEDADGTEEVRNYADP